MTEVASTAFIAVALELVDFDGDRARRDTDSHVYSDLLFLHSLGGSSPGAVAGRLTAGRLEVESRSRYAAIAQDLGLATIESSLPADTPRAELAEFLGRPGVRLITDWREEGYSLPAPAMEWHVVAFDRRLTDEELARFRDSVSEIFSDTETFRARTDSGVVYFQAWTPHDREHAITVLAALQRLDRDIAPVRSYDGLRFRWRLGR